MAQRSPAGRTVTRRRSLAAQKGAATRAAIKAWTHLSPKERKGKTKDAFITRSRAARLASAQRLAERSTRELKKPVAKRKPRRRPIAEPEPIEIKKTRKRRSKYAVSADYASRKTGSSVTIQIAATGPANASKHDAIDAANEKINTGKSPRGWTIRIINWRGSEWQGEPVASDTRPAEAWRTLSAPLALAELEVSAVGESES